jgi:hypothetical protein
MWRYTDRICQLLTEPPNWMNRSPYFWSCETGWPSYTPRHWVTSDVKRATSRTQSSLWASEGNKQTHYRFARLPSDTINRVLHNRLCSIPKTECWLIWADSQWLWGRLPDTTHFLNLAVRVPNDKIFWLPTRRRSSEQQQAKDGMFAILPSKSEHFQLWRVHEQNNSNLTCPIGQLQDVTELMLAVVNKSESAVTMGCPAKISCTNKTLRLFGYFTTLVPLTRWYRKVRVTW